MDNIPSLQNIDLSALSESQLVELQFLASEKERLDKTTADEQAVHVERTRLQRSPAAFFREAWKVLEPGNPLEWSWHYDLIGEYLQAAFLRQSKRIIINVPYRTAKAQAIDTPIPTPNGMISLCDVHVGMLVYGVTGNPIRVLAESPIYQQHECWELEFSTGEKIIADAGHEWETEARIIRPGHRKSGPPKGQKIRGVYGKCGYKTKNHRSRSSVAIRTTREIVETLHERDRNNHAVRVASAVQNIPCIHAIDPYVLGVWLGDGASSSSTLTIGEQDKHEFMRLIPLAGESIKFMGVKKGTQNGTYRLGKTTVEGIASQFTFRSRLRSAGVLGNKHIPETYFSGSIEQRSALLQGLMDTDGTAGKNGELSFVNCNERLARDVKRLVCSLGIKATIGGYPAKLNGRIVGTAWKVSFWAFADQPVFRLQRKAKRQKQRGKWDLQRNRYIVNARRVESVPVKCLIVDSPDSLFLVTDGFIPTHNSSYVTVSWPAWCWANDQTTRFLLGSFSDDLSTDLSIKRRSLIQSAWYQRLWRIPLSRDTNRQDQYKNENQGEMIATSVGGTATGRGGNFLILDDSLKAKEAKSKLKQKELHDWYKSTWVRRLNDPANSVMVVIEQRTSMNDITGWLIENEGLLDSGGQWEHLVVPTECETVTKYTYPMTGRIHVREVGDILQPKRHTPDVIRNRKIYATQWATQDQQRPSPEGGSIFKTEWWKYYDAAPSKWDQVITTWDFAVEGEDRNDFNCGICMGRIGADTYLIDFVMKRLAFTQQLQAFKNFAAAHPYATRHLVEKKANGPAIINSLHSIISGVIAIEPQGSKEQRADAASPDCESGNVHLPNGAPWVHQFVQNLGDFPLGANDDDVDAFSQGINWLRTHVYAYGLIAYVKAQTEKNRIEAMEYANMGKPDAGNNRATCPICKATTVVRIAQTMKCNSCQATWPAGKALGEMPTNTYLRPTGPGMRK